jgi:hypothetical protein
MDDDFVEFDRFPLELFRSTNAAVELAVAKAAPLFRLQGWTYAFTNGTPDSNYLVETLRGLCESIYNDPDHNATGTGHFSVAYDGTNFQIYLDLAETDLTYPEDE